MLKGKNIVLGICGGIAAYKSVSLLRLLQKNGADVQVVITPAGKEFITPVTLSALSRKPVVSEFFSANTGEWHSHVDLGIWADMMVIAPATASTIGKMVSGIADNMLVTTYFSMKGPVMIAPAMDLDMYRHPTTRRNLEQLSADRVEIVEASSGYLASGLEGKGRMAEPDEILDHIIKYFQRGRELVGKRVLITAGPTYEKLDPVRYIGNYSTGKMGFAIAEEFIRRGADTTIVAGPVDLRTPVGARRIDVESALEMKAAVEDNFESSDIAVFAAAVADYRPAIYSDTKIKREEGEAPVIELIKNPDIAAETGKQKKDGQITVGFALETDEGLEQACKKLNRKNLDIVVLNSLKDDGAGFGTDTNKITLVTKSDIEKFPLKSKHKVASDIVDKIIRIMACMILFIAAGFTTVNAQEFRATVEVNSQKVEGTNKSVFESLQESLNSYMNETQFSNAVFSPVEKIECRFFFTISEYDDDRMKGDLQIQLIRPVYNSTYTTTLFNFKDTKIEFNYRDGDPVIYNSQQPDNNLTAIMDYYANLLLGIDFDSFSSRGGQPFFDRAQSIVQLMQSSGEVGWRTFDDTKNRSAVLNTYMDSNTAAIRDMNYQYHRRGLDEMVTSPDRGRQQITEAIKAIQNVYETAPMSVALSIFRDSKLDELVNVYSKAPESERNDVYEMLQPIYPTESTRLNQIKNPENK